MYQRSILGCVVFQRKKYLADTQSRMALSSEIIKINIILGCIKDQFWGVWLFIERIKYPTSTHMALSYKDQYNSGVFQGSIPGCIIVQRKKYHASTHNQGWLCHTRINIILGCIKDQFWGVLYNYSKKEISCSSKQYNLSSKITRMTISIKAALPTPYLILNWE